MRVWRAAVVLCALVLSSAGWLRAQPVEVEGAQWAEFDANAGVWTLRGDRLRVRRADWWLEARVVRYRASEGTFEAEGPIRARQAEILSVAASTGRGSVREGWVELEGEVEMEYRTEQGIVWVRAPQARVDFVRRRAEARGGVEVVWGEALLRAHSVVADGDELTAQGQPLATWGPMRLRAGLLRAALRTGILWALDGVHGEHPLGTFRSREAEVRWREQVAMLRGTVRVDRGGEQLEAEEVRYYWSTGRAVASGRARIVSFP